VSSLALSTSHVCIRNFLDQLSWTIVNVVPFLMITELYIKCDLKLRPIVANTSTIAMSGFRKQFMRNWFAVEVNRFRVLERRLFTNSFCHRQFPCQSTSLVSRGRINLDYSYVIISTVIAGGTWYLGHLARGPTSESSIF
jgi:hypothetical protein